MTTIHDMATEERPRERMWNKGPGALKTSELIAILLRTGMAGRSALQIGDDLLIRYQSLESLCRADLRDLSSIKGVGPAKAVQLRAAFELGSRLSRSVAVERPIDEPERVMELLGDEMRHLPYESLRVLAVNSRLHLIACEEVSKGTVNETVAHPRDVFRVALLHSAYGILVVHNHPSGDPAPSQADLDFTLRLKEAASLLQITFMDHVILGSPTEIRQPYYSFKEAGYL